jgi:hypothetical protein
MKTAIDWISHWEKWNVRSVGIKRGNTFFEIYPWVKVKLLHKWIMNTENHQVRGGKLLWNQVQSLFFGWTALFKRYDYWIISNYLERVYKEGKWWDKLFDPITDQLGQSKTCFIELQFFVKYRRRDVYSQNIISKAWWMLPEEFISGILKLFPKKIDGQEYLSRMMKDLNVEVNVESIVTKNYAQYVWMKFLLRILRPPKVVFLSVSYSNFGYIRAFKESGIRVVEVQHGLIGSSHFSYTYNADFDNIQFPDDFLVFGNNDVQSLKRMRFPVTNIFPIGKSVILPLYNRVGAITGRVKSVSVALQDGEFSFQLLRFVICCASTWGKSIRWVIQNRRMSRSEIERAMQFPENVIWSETDMYECIVNCDAHLTIYSTTSIEALSIGRVVLLYNYDQLSDYHLGKSLMGQKGVYFVNESEDLRLVLQQLNDIDKEELAISNQNNIAFDYHDHLKKYLNEYLEIDQ